MNTAAIQPIEIRDSTFARRFVLEGLMVQSVSPASPRSVRTALEWYLEAAALGVPLPPIGVVADVGYLAFGDDANSGAGESATPKTHSREQFPLPSTLTRQYEDLFLGKLYTDRSFDRGIDGMRRYSDRRDRAKALAFVIRQIGRRAGFSGVTLSPAVIRELSRLEGEELLATASENLIQNGPLAWDELDVRPTQHAEESDASFLESLYQELVQKVRGLGEVLGAEDVFELEHGTAIAGFGQQVALRQVLEAATRLEGFVPRQPVRPLDRRPQVATKIIDEDTYPIGGFSSISNRGSVESLLHSQLAYMEPDDRPDMFDVKFLRDELLYYSRDENQFLRRRRRFVFAVFPDLAAARIKDPHMPWQRIVLLLGMLVVAVNKLIEWLSEDALTFEFLFLLDPEKKPGKNPADLSDERELLEVLFREQIANGTVLLTDADSLEEFQERCNRSARCGLCHGILISTEQHPLEIETALITQITLNGPVPVIAIDDGQLESDASANPTEQWGETLVQLLAAWVAG